MAALGVFAVLGGVYYISRQNRSQVFLGAGPTAALDDNLEDSTDVFAFQYENNLKERLGQDHTQYDNNFMMQGDVLSDLLAAIQQHKKSISQTNNNRSALERTNKLIARVEKAQKMVNDLVKIKVDFDKLAAKKGIKSVKKVQTLIVRVNKHLDALKKIANSENNITDYTWFYHYAVYLKTRINSLLPADQRSLVLGINGLAGVHEQRWDEHYLEVLETVETPPPNENEEASRAFQERLDAKIAALEIFNVKLDKSSHIKKTVSALCEYLNELKKCREKAISLFKEIQDEYSKTETPDPKKIEELAGNLEKIASLLANRKILSEDHHTWVIQYHQDTRAFFDRYQALLSNIENQIKLNQLKKDILAPCSTGESPIGNRIEYYHREFVRIEAEFISIQKFFVKEEKFETRLGEAKFFGQLMADLLVLDYNVRVLEGGFSKKEKEKNAKHQLSRTLSELNDILKKIPRSLEAIKYMERYKLEESPVFKWAQELIVRFETILSNIERERKEAELFKKISDDIIVLSLEVNQEFTRANYVNVIDGNTEKAFNRLREKANEIDNLTETISNPEKKNPLKSKLEIHKKDIEFIYEQAAALNSFKQSLSEITALPIGQARNEKLDVLLRALSGHRSKYSDNHEYCLKNVFNGLMSEIRMLGSLSCSRGEAELPAFYPIALENDKPPLSSTKAASSMLGIIRDSAATAITTFATTLSLSSTSGSTGEKNPQEDTPLLSAENTQKPGMKPENDMEEVISGFDVIEESSLHPEQSFSAPLREGLRNFHTLAPPTPKGRDGAGGSLGFLSQSSKSSDKDSKSDKETHRSQERAYSLMDLNEDEKRLTGKAKQLLDAVPSFRTLNSKLPHSKYLQHYLFSLKDILEAFATSKEININETPVLLNAWGKQFMTDPVVQHFIKQAVGGEKSEDSLGNLIVNLMTDNMSNQLKIIDKGANNPQLPQLIKLDRLKKLTEIVERWVAEPSEERVLLIKLQGYLSGPSNRGSFSGNPNRVLPPPKPAPPFSPVLESEPKAESSGSENHLEVAESDWCDLSGYSSS